MKKLSALFKLIAFVAVIFGLVYFVMLFARPAEAHTGQDPWCGEPFAVHHVNDHTVQEQVVNGEVLTIIYLEDGYAIVVSGCTARLMTYVDIFADCFGSPFARQGRGRILNFNPVYGNIPPEGCPEGEHLYLSARTVGPGCGPDGGFRFVRRVFDPDPADLPPCMIVFDGMPAAVCSPPCGPSIMVPPFWD
jgi:hypothetical protein